MQVTLIYCGTHTKTEDVMFTHSPSINFRWHDMKYFFGINELHRVHFRTKGPAVTPYR